MGIVDGANGGGMVGFAGDEKRSVAILVLLIGITSGLGQHLACFPLTVLGRMMKGVAIVHVEFIDNATDGTWRLSVLEESDKGADLK